MGTRALLNLPLLRHRRTELGFSIRAVAEAIGITGPAYTAIEGGFGHAELPLVTVVRLGALLGLGLDQLVESAGDAPATPPTADTDALAADASALGAVLFATRTLTPVGTLCEVHGWSLERLHAAERALEHELSHVGIALCRQNARLNLARAAQAVDDKVLQRALRMHLGRDHLSVIEARLLHHIEHGDVPTQPSNPERVALGMLTNAGLVITTPGRAKGEAPLVLAEDVCFSLMLDEDPEPAARPRRRRRSPASAPDVPTNNAPRGRDEKQQP
jgi:hypothetical protein